MVNKKIVAGLTLALIALPQSSSAFASAKDGAKCSKAGTKATTKGVEFTCVKKGSKLIWSKAKTSATKETINQINARKKAASYLSLTAFSRSGLIKQLEFEGFSNADATYGADAQNAEWNKQAAKAAGNYLKLSAFSRSGLIKQLEYEGYSNEDATFGTDAQNADWNKQAAKAAASYLALTPFSRSGLIEQLVYEGYTAEQAASGVASTGLK